MKKELAFVYLHRNKRIYNAIWDGGTLLREATLEPIRCNELVGDWPDYIGIRNASIHGIGGIIIREMKVYTPIVFWLPWPQDIKDNTITI